jgi:hypothetical protein
MTTEDPMAPGPVDVSTWPCRMRPSSWYPSRAGTGAFVTRFRSLRHRLAEQAWAGRKTTASAYDALIAAVAVANGLPVYTCNAADFDGIDGLHVVPVSVADEVTA